MRLSPIVVFVYNRPHHTKQTIEALQKNDLAQESELFIYSDGAKNEQSLEKVAEVREYIKTINGFKKITIIERERNWGLADSIINGVTEIVNKYGKIIVLEDDLITSKTFLPYMNKCLDLYQDYNQVISISAYVYPINYNKQEVFFIKGADCWGWATWKRGWDLFNPNGKELYEIIKEQKQVKEFDFDNTYNYFKMLKDQTKGKNNSWAVRWYASAFINNKLTLYPSRPLVVNIGLDNSGTHCRVNHKFGDTLNDLNLDSILIPVEANQDGFEHFKHYFKSNRSLGRDLVIFFKSLIVR